MGCITGLRIDYNGIGAQRGQRHIPSKNEPKYPPPSPPGICRGTTSSWFLVELEFGNVGFRGEGETGAKERTNDKLNPHMASIPTLTTATPLIPRSCLQPSDKAAMLDVKKRIFHEEFTWKRVKFQEETNAFVLDHHHGRRDVTCKPAIALVYFVSRFLLNGRFYFCFYLNSTLNTRKLW